MGMGIIRRQRTLLLALAAILAFLAPVAPAAAAPGDPLAAAAQVEPAVVRIDTAVDYQGVVGLGTGFVIDPGGQVLTNFHVVQGADRITGTVGDIANAVWNATGVRVREMPITLDKLLG